MKRAVFIALTALSFAGCEDEGNLCTLELGSAVDVRVRSPEGLEVDRVTADNGEEFDCSLMEEGATPEEVSTFWCNEAGGGEYTVRIYSGDLVWTRKVKVEADECHVTKAGQVEVSLTEDNADE